MKRLILIAVSLLCLTTFVSCNNDKDDPIIEDQTPTVDPELYKNSTFLKNLTDRDIDSVIDEIEAEGVFYAGGAPIDSEIYLHLFANDEMSDAYMLYEAKEVIFMAARFHGLEYREDGFELFEIYNSEPDHMLAGVEYEYVGFIEDNNGNDFDFPCSDSFMNYYNENKDDIYSCMAIWDTELEQISPLIQYNDVYMPMIIYINKPITPPSMLEEGVAKTLSETITMSIKK